MPELSLSDWSSLSDLERQALLARPAVSSVEPTQCQAIIDRVRHNGDQALFEFTKKFDQIELDTLRVTPEKMTSAATQVSKQQLDALMAAYANIRLFHQAQVISPVRTQPSKGVSCELHYRPIESVGLYVPGGTAPLPSTVLMLGVPSQIAGCPTRVLCTPPQSNGQVDPLVLAAAKLCGIEQVFSVGGAQAIAGMAYGTKTIPKVNKIYGPGNPWVTKAKQLVSQDPHGAACDLPAGPSEVLVIADGQAQATHVAADLLSQAEHGIDSQVLLLTTDSELAKAVQQEVTRQLLDLPRAELARQALVNSAIVIVSSIEEALQISNLYGPEHLIINTDNASSYIPQVKSAGSVFVGPWSPEAMGDYCSGTNHVLPTHGFAHNHSGVGVIDFQKRISVQEFTRAGLKEMAWIAQTLARAEGLEAHAMAIDVRLKAQSKQADATSSKRKSIVSKQSL